MIWKHHFYPQILLSEIYKISSISATFLEILIKFGRFSSYPTKFSGISRIFKKSHRLWWEFQKVSRKLTNVGGSFKISKNQWFRWKFKKGSRKLTEIGENFKISRKLNEFGEILKILWKLSDIVWYILIYFLDRLLRNSKLVTINIHIRWICVTGLWQLLYIGFMSQIWASYYRYIHTKGSVHKLVTVTINIHQHRICVTNFKITKYYY